MLSKLLQALLKSREPTPLHPLQQLLRPRPSQNILLVLLLVRRRIHEGPLRVQLPQQRNRVGQVLGERVAKDALPLGLRVQQRRDVQHGRVVRVDLVLRRQAGRQGHVAVPGGLEHPGRRREALVRDVEDLADHQVGQHRVDAKVQAPGALALLLAERPHGLLLQHLARLVDGHGLRRVAGRRVVRPLDGGGVEVVDGQVLWGAGGRVRGGGGGRGLHEALDGGRGVRGSEGGFGEVDGGRDDFFRVCAEGDV